MARSILVTGATGTIGSYLLPALATRADVWVRALTRNPENAQALADSGAEVSRGMFEDAASLDAAMDKIDTVILIVPPGPECVTSNKAIIDAAKRTGVTKIVRISAIKAAEDERTENTRLHGRCDRLLRESGLSYTILRPNYFMQNIFMSLPSINADRVFHAGMGQGRVAMIDARDVAESAAAAAMSNEFDDQALEISGPQSITFSDVAKAISEVANREITYVAVTPEDIEASLLQMGVDAWMAELLREYSAAYSEGWGDLVTKNVDRLTGHPARSFRQFAEELLAPALT